MSVRLMEDVTGISKSQVHRIRNEDLKLRKVCARFVPHCLGDSLIADNDPNFLKTIVAGDETWCFQYEPFTKQLSAVWKSLEDSE